ncbi:transglutaminase domain-containing protein [Ruminococcus sp. FC2018]|uniref:transglutaminase-like domain-containing protein n=1 Tax=Ruminococcus sp. FC2018 TaxID=1410617 RepID=UPI000688AF43|nr:transglutaminase domain-containing protein [Ruminococcus sp. FC2018]
MQFLKKHKKTIEIFFTKYFLAMALCYSVMRLIIVQYFTTDVRMYSLISLAFMSLLLFTYEKIKRIKLVRGIIFLVIGGALILVCRLLLTRGFDRSGVWFMNWFYVSSAEAGQVGEYSATVLIFFSFFLVSIVYYFSVIRFRASGLMLAVLLPFIIYGKRAQSIDGIDLVFMITVYLALVIHGKLSADDVKKDTVFNYSYVIASLVFVTFVGMVTMFVPKPQVTSYLENNRNFFDLRINSNLSAFSSLNDESSDRFGSNAVGEVLFKVRTNSSDDLLLLRRQSFDVFNDKERWVTDRNISGEMESYGSASANPIGSAKSYFDIMKDTASKLDLTDAQQKASLDFFNTADLYTQNDLRYINLSYEENFSPRYVCAELNIDDANRNNSPQVYKTTHSETYYNSGGTYSSVTYLYYPQKQSVVDFAKSQPYDTQGFVKILDRALKQGAIRPQNYAAITSTIDTFTNKDYYKISERMAQLALDITKDCKNDYEKAQAIVNYFATNGFTYDMDYIPPDESIDYFMFESKTGSCTSYATAMVLMARYVGVPARYVEGFAAFEKDTNDDSVFVVKDTNAHAFVECYIPAVGWMSFDPTVPEYMRVSSASGNAAGIISDVAKILGRIALFAGVLFVIVFIILLDRIEERVFRVRLHFKNSSEKPILVYQHIIKLMNRVRSSRHFEGYTPHRLEEYVRTELKGDIGLIVELFEKTCFGGIEPTEEEFKMAYEQYKHNWKLLAKGKRVAKEKGVKAVQIS